MGSHKTPRQGRNRVVTALSGRRRTAACPGSGVLHTGHSVQRAGRTLRRKKRKRAQRASHGRPHIGLARPTGHGQANRQFVRPHSWGQYTRHADLTEHTLLATQHPPTIDPVAARRWHSLLVQPSAWLHEEVGRRMEERLNWIKLEPQAWLHAEPLRGGMEQYALLTARYKNSEVFFDIADKKHRVLASKFIAKPWWSPARWKTPKPVLALGQSQDQPGEGSYQMVWANMALHMSAQPQALIARWHRALSMDGFLMFSWLGPDSLKELRPLYREQGWGEPAHAFTDMHDWGDMLVAQGFAEPVLDMEHITLSYETPERLLQDLRGLGRNLNVGRFKGLRGRAWYQKLKQALAYHLADPADAGRLKLTFEVIYGHALKPARKLVVQPELNLSLQDMRQALKTGQLSRPGKTRPE